MSREMLLLVDALAREKNVAKEVVFGALEMALASATKKRIHDEADVRQALVACPVGDVVQHQHIQRGQVLEAGGAHAVHDPAVKRIARHHEAELKFAHLGTLGGDQVRRRHNQRAISRLAGFDGGPRGQACSPSGAISKATGSN